VANEITIAVKDSGTAAAVAGLERVRVAARALSSTSATINVDADTASADAKLATTWAEVLGLSGDTAHVNVDADTAAADAELGITNAEVSRLDGRTARVRVDADVAGALAAIASVGIAMSALGGIGGGIGAIGGGILGLGGMSLGAGAAGVAGLIGTAAAFSGIGDAVKDLGKQQAAAGGSAGKAARDNMALASALDQVKSAQRRLSSAQADARDEASRSAEQLANARHDVVRASQDEADAQQALNDAYDEARRHLADLQQQTEDMALSQRDAALRVAEAQQNLVDVNRSRHSTSNDRDRAQLELDQALQRQKELARAAQELAKDKKEADAKGVAGSDAVVAASGRVADAHERTLAAQRQVTDATAAAATQARHSADSIASAQQGVVDAERAVARAHQSAASAAGGGGAAASKLASDMDKLSPAGQRFAKFMRGFIDGPIRDFQHAAQEAILPFVQEGLEAAIPVIKELTPQFSGLLSEMAKGGEKLFETALKLAPAFLDLADAGAKGLGPLLPVLQQVATDVAGVIEELVNTGEINQLMGSFDQIIGLIAQSLPETILLMADLGEQIGPELIPLVAELIPFIIQLIRVSGPLLVGALRLTTAVLKVFNRGLAELPGDAHKAAQGARGVGSAVEWTGHRLAQGVRAIYGFMKDSIKYLDGLRAWISSHADSIWRGIIDGAKNMYYSAAGWLDSLGSKARNLGSTIYDNTIGSLPGFAHGGIVGAAAGGGPRGNWTMVGEHGRELVRLPAGSQVSSNPDTERQLAHGGGSSAASLVRLDSSDALVGALLEMIRKAVRTRGGNVQIVLGAS
jgi:hypothetical protein